MKILLCEDVRDLGWLGDVVDVADGYARNYLLPYGLAMVPTEDNIRQLAEEKAKRAEQRLKEKKRMEQAAEKVEGAEVVLAARTNELGHLFGSVTEKDIAANLREQGFDVADDVVRLSTHIKESGYYPGVTLKYSPEITASVDVVVVNEEQARESLEDAAEAVKSAVLAEESGGEEAEQAVDSGEQAESASKGEAGSSEAGEETEEKAE
jgi:large subunit ribosomal protein L9